MITADGHFLDGSKRKSIWGEMVLVLSFCMMTVDAFIFRGRANALSAETFDLNGHITSSLSYFQAVCGRDALFFTTVFMEGSDAQPNLKDDIVLIKEEGPPGTWPMVRVLQVHSGNDGMVRVAAVKIQDSVYKRLAHKLCKLPIYPN
ncbi:hypothetical protein TNIN_479451 [Trichonephila inaurata madagascariensis]|uniref:DUF5641 domain-containing protein n=1 Tax=Trichonephila inaurata madagascariensis TaxID=2747483 RepID=A0A8X6IWY5_9ARAC|nr:hypothetical protein TNIN_479451 [Trichonephila inaurata madagascariensis]